MRIGDRVKFKDGVTPKTLEANGIEEDYVHPGLGVVMDYPMYIRFPDYQTIWMCLGLVEPALSLGTKVRLTVPYAEYAEDGDTLMVTGYTDWGYYLVEGDHHEFCVPPCHLEEVK